MSAAILAGGKSTRMGKDKSLLDINGRSVIEKIFIKTQELCKDTIIIANEQEKYQFLNAKIYQDRYPGKGPLSGLESALFYTDSDYVLVSACDTPFISNNVYQFLIGILEKEPQLDAVVPKFKNKLHPLSGIYHRRILKDIQCCIAKNDLRVISFFQEIEYRLVEEFDNINNKELDLHFFNMNHPDEYEWAKNLNYKF